MNDVQEKITSYLDGLESRLGKAEELVISEVPQFVSELLAYHWWGNLIWVCLALLGLLSLVATSYHLLKNSKKVTPGVDQGEFVLFITGISLILAAGCIAFLMLSITTMVKISVAPRVYVVDYLRSEVQK
jgi:hypothetical protein